MIRDRLGRTAVPVAAAILAAATCVTAPARGASRTLDAFSYDDLYRIVSIGSPQLAPDGAHALVHVGRSDRANDRRLGELDLVDLADGTLRRIAADLDGAGAARWSPAGDRIAFIASSAAGAPREAYVARADGSEAHAVTAAPGGVLQFAWRPDGRALAYVALDDAPEKTGDARYLDGYEVGNEAQLARGAARAAHVWLQPLDGTAARPLTGSAGSAAYGDAESTLTFSPDGARLAYVHTPNGVANDATRAAMRVVDVASGTERDLGVVAAHVRDPLFSPDGTRLAYVHAASDPQVTPNVAYVAAANGTAPRAVSSAIDRTVLDIGWQPGSQTLWFTANDGTQRRAYRVVNGVAHGVPLPISVLSGLDGALARDGSLLFVGSSAQQPDELYLARPGAALRRVTHLNDDVAARAGATSERITYPTTTGVRGDAVLVRPAGFDRARRYPLVVIVHGGPTSAELETFDELAQLMAARGWLVLEPNYRGSNNLGARYQAAVRGDKLRGPGRDIEAAIAAVAARGIVDARRLAVSGWSYGAGMTLWMIESRHDWRAAVAGAAVTDIAADYATADDIDADRALVPGSPFTPGGRERARAQSPITYVSSVRTPLLLMTDRGDDRVSPAGVYEFYHALRDLGRPVSLIAYPVDGHWPSDPVRSADVYKRWIDFVARHFASGSVPPVRSAHGAPAS